MSADTEKKMVVGRRAYEVAARLGHEIAAANCFAFTGEGRDHSADCLLTQTVLARELKPIFNAHADMRAAIRKLAIRSHVRLAYGGSVVPSGGHCELCKGEWEHGEAEAHVDGCFAALAQLDQVKT